MPMVGTRLPHGLSDFSSQMCLARQFPSWANLARISEGEPRLKPVGPAPF
jgi:hypothetical protein